MKFFSSKELDETSLKLIKLDCGALFRRLTIAADQISSWLFFRKKMNSSIFVIFVFAAAILVVVSSVI